MMAELFCLLEVVTTGRGIGQRKLLEICAMRFTGKICTHKFRSLLDPQVALSSYVMESTGLDDDMLRGQPLFGEVAEQVWNLTEGALLISSDVHFHHMVLQHAFSEVGLLFNVPKFSLPVLCRKLIPGLLSYRMDYVLSTLGIPWDGEDGAEAKVTAMSVLLGRLLDLDEDRRVIHSRSLIGKKTFSPPEHLERYALERLPPLQGVYYFMCNKGNVLYVGKSKNIRKRAMDHFRSARSSERELCKRTYDIHFEVTGNELLALLLEADGIQQYLPIHNTLQKKIRLPYRIVSSSGPKGILRISVKRSVFSDLGQTSFYNRAQALQKVGELCLRFQLCPIYCGLGKDFIKNSNNRECPCGGICSGREEKYRYNKRVMKAISVLEGLSDSYIIREKGRGKNEDSFVLVSEGRYKGFGYVPKEEGISHFGEFHNFLEPRSDTNHTSAIIHNYLRKNPYAVLIDKEGNRIVP
tara:strand:+ start:19811 stop:21211 length:1401 start_codon:yes stop_codon:yes gene_type:complete